MVRMAQSSDLVGGMNATVPARLRIVGSNEHTLIVEPYGFPMVCEFEFYPGESGTFTTPGTPDNLQMLSCTVGGVDIVDMLSNSQRERIEELLLEGMQ
jgi:hypothetical protein